MLFHTLDYLVFLPLALLIYWVVPIRWRLGVLATGSVAFYASWSALYLPVLLGVTATAWLGGLWITRRAGRDGVGTRRVLSLAVLLVPLLFFKYWDWIAENIELVVRYTAVADFALPRVEMPLPVGISFFTFQALAYVIDVARDGPNDEGAERNLLRFGTFLGFFPQLVAGPIVRRFELLPQLRNLPLLELDHVGSGVFRILRGLAKKILVADVVRVAMVDPIFDDPGAFTGLELLVGLYAYTLQIYYDFSAYTDIAVGSARLFGIELPENFRRPYKATSVAGFWRRWHITLSNWVRDYIYYPLGGSQVAGGQWRVYRNIMMTLLIIGIWHGASWNFVVYGLLHGSAVAINRWQRKRTGRRPDDALPGAWAWAWRWCLTFHFVVFARILFRAPDFPTAGNILGGMGDWHLLLPRFSPTAFAVVAVGYAIHFTPDRWSTSAESWFRAQGPLLWAGSAAAVGAACAALGTGEYLAFVYYQF